MAEPRPDRPGPRFNQTDADLALSFPNVIGAQPLRLFAEFVYNWDAVNDDAYGYLGGLRLGRHGLARGGPTAA